MNRFFVLADQIKSSRISFTPEESFQIRNVLRMKRGERVTVLNNQGKEWQVELTNLSKQGVIGSIIHEASHPPHSKPLISLALPPVSPSKMDWIIQKSTELGVHEILPFACERTVKKKVGENRISRWTKIAREAAEQSERIYIPLIKKPVSFSDLLQMRHNRFLKLIFWEQEKTSSIKSIAIENDFSCFDNILIVIGPEGGFEAEEIELARQAGFLAVGLGQKILRVETAALAALSIIQFSLGRLG